MFWERLSINIHCLVSSVSNLVLLWLTMQRRSYCRYIFYQYMIRVFYGVQLNENEINKIVGWIALMLWERLPINKCKMRIPL